MSGSNKEFSQFAAQTPGDVTALQLAGFDPSKPAGARNVRIGAQAMLAAFMAANAAESSGTGGTFSNHVVGIVVPIGGFVDTQLYAPASSSTDVCMVSLAFGQASIVPMPFSFQIYAGPPSSGNPTLLYDSAVATGGTIKTARAAAQSTIYAAAAGGTNVLWIRTYNAGVIAITYAFQGVFLEFSGAGVALPSYVPPPLYTGPLLSTVHVGAGEQFIEPQYGLQALADGGTMFLDDGHYFLPMCVSSTADADQTPATNQHASVFGYSGAHPTNRFSSVSIIGNSTYGCVWDGLGGIGNGFRLAEGKGILLMHVPGLVKGINFISGGGANDDVFGGGGECGLYAEGFVADGTLNVQNVGFDNCADGLFAGDVDLPNADGTYTENGGPGANVSLVLSACDFGLNAPNGITPDGGSHNIYNECKSLSIVGCHVYTALYGNTVKCRGPLINVSGSYIEGGAGRALDQPEGGSVTMTNTILNIIAAANQPFMGYNNENTRRPFRVQSDPQLTGCTVIDGRVAGNQASQVWYNNPSGQYVFTNTTQQWIGTGQTLQPVRSQTAGIGADPTACAGLFLSSAGGGAIAPAYPRPGSIAQPGYAPTSFNAWNGTV